MHMSFLMTEPFDPAHTGLFAFSSKKRVSRSFATLSKVSKFGYSSVQITLDTLYSYHLSWCVCTLLYYALYLGCVLIASVVYEHFCVLCAQNSLNQLLNHLSFLFSFFEQSKIKQLVLLFHIRCSKMFVLLFLVSDEV